jgi:hypothetical protein
VFVCLVGWLIGFVACHHHMPICCCLCGGGGGGRDHGSMIWLQGAGVLFGNRGACVRVWDPASKTATVAWRSNLAPQGSSADYQYDISIT